MEWIQRVRVASPCKADWDTMEGNERARFCRLCNKHVYNFSAMTPDEIATVVRAKEGRLCARFYQRPDGTMLTADCPVGRRRQRRRDWFGLCLGVLGMLAAGAGIAAVSDQLHGSAASQQTILATLQGKIRAIFRPSTPLVNCRVPTMGKFAVMGDVVFVPPPATNQINCTTPTP